VGRYGAGVARVEIGEDSLTVRLSPLQRTLSFTRTVRVPLSSIRRTSVAESKWLALRGWRSAGVAMAGVIAIGTRRHGTGWDFTAVDRHHDAVLIELNSGRFEQLLISVPDAPEVAHRIAAAAGIAG
jgi:hypothetical protein